MRLSLFVRKIIFAALLSMVPSLTASPVVLWQIGQDEDPLATGYSPTDEFSSDNGSSNVGPGRVTRLPADPQYDAVNNPTRDDHFYQIGTYPSGYNNLTSPLQVPFAEPDKAFERSITNADPENRIHFMLNAGEASANSRLRLTFDLISGGSWSPVTGSGENFGKHDVSVRFINSAANVLLLNRVGIDGDRRMTIDFPASSVQAVAGPNSILLRRNGPPPPAGDFSWIQFDFVRLEVDGDGLLDGDGDGLPRWWEEENQLNDATAADASADLDGDGLTALQEYNSGNMSSDPQIADSDGDGLLDAQERAAGSHPMLADTDDDDLSDFSEVTVSPTSSPLMIDSDGDGAPDAFEKRVGSLPNSASSSPISFAGGIALNFVGSDQPQSAVPSHKPAGWVPQLHWNNTLPLRSWSRGSGNTADIVGSNIGQFSRSNGVAVPGMSIAWTSNNLQASDNDGAADRKVMNSLIAANNTTPATVNISGVPFSQYHVIAYVGSAYDGQKGEVILNGLPANARPYTSMSMAPQSDWVEVMRASTEVSHPMGNYVMYRNLTSPSFSLQVRNVDGWTIGLHGLQIIDATLDADSSSIPDWYELRHALQPANAATAAADPDGDGLSNFQEFQRSSNPRKLDTDGDGLNDNEESAENSLLVDSDGDGLSDFEEVKSTLPSNPNSIDSNGDGISDKLTKERYLSPTQPLSSSFVPTYRATPAPAQWEWKLEPVHLHWDHGVASAGGGDGYNTSLITFYVGNVVNNADVSLRMRLQITNGRLTYSFRSESAHAFSAANSPTTNINLSDSNFLPSDLKNALGFSGYGSNDLSDPLRFRMLATKGVGDLWNVTFEIFNLRKNQAAITRLVSQSSAVASIQNGTATWRDDDGNVGIPSVDARPGMKVFIGSSTLLTHPNFANMLDADDDGMPNVWETTYGLNINLANDAQLDADGDGLKNLDEFLLGSNPLLTDTDGDGFSDRIEMLEHSNPLLALSRPAFISNEITQAGDFNKNQMSDAWEAHYRLNALSPNQDDDGDGAANVLEAKWGTDPLDPNSKVQLTMATEANDVLLNWPRSPWKRQRILHGQNLSNWQALNLPTAPNGSNSQMRIPNPFSQSNSMFYALESNDQDTDADGIADWDENFFGSDPYERNSIRKESLMLHSSGAIAGTVAGDYAAFSEQFKNALTAPPSATQVSREQAARLLQQATFGATTAAIEKVQSLGIRGWIDDQLQQAPTLHRPIIEAMVNDLRGPRTDLSYNYFDRYVSGNNASTAFARGAIRGEDQLRQRVAFALSQILVTSRRDGNLNDRPVSMAGYYDIFVKHAFGNYHDILREVTLNPMMGRYLSHIGNQKARPEINQFPDENFARELMQLFTIGLWELNPDGTRKVVTGNFIPTYNNEDITEMSRVFTGLWFGGIRWGRGGYQDEDSSTPMKMWAEKHDFDRKQMLGALVIPARAATPENGMRDIEDALRYLMRHPNTAPFISKQLIQFLVTSNPSSAYVNRVSQIFSNNGAGKRGDLGAVVRAILLDEEARDVRWSLAAKDFGRLKEPVHRAMAVARLGRLERFPNLIWYDYGEFYENALQSPGYSPSVFNFFRPDYRPPGLLTENRLAGPAFQITNSHSALSFTNQIWDQTNDGFRLYSTYRFPPDYQEFLDLATDLPALVDRVNLLLCSGMMSMATRNEILDTLSQVRASDAIQRVQIAIYLAACSPEGSVQR